MNAYLIGIGIACLASAVFLLCRRLLVLFVGVSVIGHVMGHEARTDDGSVSYLPIVEFKDSWGVAHRFTSVAGRSTHHPLQGTNVVVRYLPAHPKIAFIQSFLHMWAAPLALAVLGLAALYVFAQR